MKVLGFRADPSNARYAIVSFDGTSYTLDNANSESRLVYPADVSTVAQKVLWTYREIERIFHATKDIDTVVIKTNEFGRGANAAMRQSSYIEAALLLFSEQRRTPVYLKNYKSLDTRGASVKSDAESRVGRTAKYWDSKIADAIVAAWWGAKQP